MQYLELILAEEVAAIEAYQDGVEAVQMLNDAGIRVGVCSNLAKPYGVAVKRHFPAMAAYVFSYERGVMKPDLPMYQGLSADLNVDSYSGVVMIGDSQRCERDGPMQSNIRGFYLDRFNGKGDFSDLVSFAKW